MGSDEVSVDKHLEVAEAFATTAERTRNVDDVTLRAWTLVLAFYSAVHFVRAYLRWKKVGIRITSHEDVKDYFRTYPELAKIRVPYDTLKQVSHSVRYYGELVRPDDDFTRALCMTKQIRAWALPKIKAA